MIKKRMYVFIMVTLVVTLLNMIQQCYATKSYTITYPKTILEVQKEMDKNIIEVNDKVVTKGSVLLLATTNSNRMKLYHLKRGFLTLKYKIEMVDKDVQLGDNFHIKNCFEKFECQIEENKQLVIRPATFVSNIPCNMIAIKWLSPILSLYACIISFLEKEKER